MNEAEKKAFASLSEEEQEEVAGGEKIDGSTLLMAEQCQRLKKLLEKKPLLEEDPTEDSHAIPYLYTKMAYGGPRPEYDHPRRRETFPVQEPMVNHDGESIEN